MRLALVLALLVPIAGCGHSYFALGTVAPVPGGADVVWVTRDTNRIYRCTVAPDGSPECRRARIED